MSEIQYDKSTYTTAIPAQPTTSNSHLLVMHEHHPENEIVYLPKGAMMASITEALNVKIKRVGKYFYCTYLIGEAERVFTIDLQEITGLSDEEMAQLLTRLDANKESDKASK